jgi:hypothetical protein
MPSYISTFKELIEDDFQIFQKSIEKSSFGEENFRKTLYHCFSFSTDQIVCALFVKLLLLNKT